MTIRTDVAPSTLPVTLAESGVEVEDLDGETLATGPGKEVHVLVTGPGGTEGVMMYVNDRKTHEDILESTGVGRIVLDGGETEEIFPGVTVGSPDGMRCRVEADLSVARVRL